MPSSEPSEPSEPAARRTYDASGRRAAARRNRAAVLDACAALLLAEGTPRDTVRATTVRAVAQRAGVSPETVYKTFGGRPGLLKALWDATLAGDDEPVPMAERPELRAVWEEPEPHAKLRGYAAFVGGVHARTAALFARLGAAGPEVAEVLAAAERERLTGVTAFVHHLDAAGLLRADEDRARLADQCWVLTGPGPYTQFTAERGWDADAYRAWLTRTLAACLLP